MRGILHIRWCPLCECLTKHQIKFTTLEMEYFVCTVCDYIYIPELDDKKGDQP